MKNVVLSCLFVSVLTAIIAQANLLQNPSFEVAGTQPETAYHWKMNDPGDHGDAWGNAIRVDWRARDGRHIGAIRGAWAGLGEYGGFWQEAEISGGTEYKATAWFWADNHWSADTQEFKLEFWNADRSEKISEQSVTLHDVGETWVQKEVSAIAPDGAAWGRVVINVSGAGEHGALQVDLVALEAAW
ncbi:MAG TPA: hypothetical protein PJ991_05300 [Kiritimatiellia bacterium]|nr:hypothetical protein [Kiritimatiellia bacterium]